jgi:hypothetical protein
MCRLVSTEAASREDAHRRTRGRSDGGVSTEGPGYFDPKQRSARRSRRQGKRAIPLAPNCASMLAHVIVAVTSGFRFVAGLMTEPRHDHDRRTVTATYTTHKVAIQPRLLLRHGVLHTLLRRCAPWCYSKLSLLLHELLSALTCDPARRRLQRGIRVRTFNATVARPLNHLEHFYSVIARE